MKKLIALLLAAGIAATLVSCNSSENKEDTKKDDTVIEDSVLPENDEVKEDKEETNTNVYEDVDLAAVADSLYEGIAPDNMPMVMSMPIEDAETFKYFTFIDYEDGLEAVANEPMMSSIAHSVVLVKCPSSEKAEEVAAAMKENCDPRKWMCVEADVVEGVTNGNIAMLLMTTKDGGLSETILENFNALDAERIASLVSADVDDVVDEEIEVTDETEAKEEESEKVENEASEENEEPAVKDEETVTEDETVIAPAPETTVDPENSAVIYPNENTDAEIDNVSATMPEEDSTPAVMPEAPVVDETPTVEPEADASSDNVTIDVLYSIADKLYDGIAPDSMPMVGTMELTGENFEYSAFVPYKSSYLAVESMPMMGSQPHSVVIVKTDSAAEAASLAAQMEANADPRKWICVNARKVRSASKGNYALLVMTSVDVMPGDGIDETQAEKMSEEQSEERANTIIRNFLAAVE